MTSRGGTKVIRKHAVGILALAAIATVAGSALAQARSDETRAQVKMETKEFLKTHRYDETTDTWTLKSGVEPPEGVKTRAEIKADRDEFLKKNHWDETTSAWVPRDASKPALSSLTRDQRRAAERAFNKTHRFDEANGEWVSK